MALKKKYKTKKITLVQNCKKYFKIENIMKIMVYPHLFQNLLSETIVFEQYSNAYFALFCYAYYFLQDW